MLCPQGEKLKKREMRIQVKTMREIDITMENWILTRDWVL